MCYIHKIIAIFAIEYVSDCLHNSRPDIGADTECPLGSRMDRLQDCRNHSSVQVVWNRGNSGSGSLLGHIGLRIFHWQMEN